jgi:hypothetical protein
MGFLDSVLSNTVGLAYRAATGNVDPWTLATIKDDSNAGIKQALGPGASDADVAAAQVSAQNEIDNYLHSIKAHPDDACGLRLPVLGCVEDPEFLAKLNKIVYGLIAVGAVVGLFYFSQRYGTVIKKTFRKR